MCVYKVIHDILTVCIAVCCLQRQEEIATGNPCPICRDEYLVLDYRNVKLLQQFICPHTGSILSFT